MALFETGTYTAPSDLLQKLATALNTAGWTVVRQNGLGGDGPSGENQMTITEGSNGHWHFIATDATTTANISFQPSTGDSGISTAFYNHTGSPVNSGSQGTYPVMGQLDPTTPVAQGFEGAGTYWFFMGETAASDRYVHVVIEGTAGVFWHMAFGTGEKAIAVNGAQYATACLFIDNNHLWIFSDKSTQDRGTSWLRDDDNFNSRGFSTDGDVSLWHRNIGFAGEHANSLLNTLYQGGIQTWNQRTPMAPCWLRVWDSTSLAPQPNSVAWKLIARAPALRLVSMDQREAKDIITLGSEEWYLFPMHVKNATQSPAFINNTSGAPAPYNETGLMGLAILKET